LVSHGVYVTIVYSFEGAYFHVSQISLQHISQIFSFLFGYLGTPSDACFNFQWFLVLFYSGFSSFVDFFISSMIVTPLCLLVIFNVDRHLLLTVVFQFEGSVMVGTHDTPLFLTPLTLVRSSGCAAAPGLTPLRFLRAPV